MSDIYQDSVALHKKHGGKLEIKSKVSLANRADLSLAYTPGVAEVCRVIAKDKSQTRSLTIKGNTVAVITDGSAILGLGNLGPEAALPVMEGKCILFKEFAGVDAFPICLDTQDEEEIIKAVKQLAPVFGGINLEDISAPRCFKIEERLRAELDIPVMHDDQHGTATVVLAALINALKVRGSQKEEVKIIISGAGAAGVAVTKLLLSYGFVSVIVCDSVGIIYEGREGLNPVKQELAIITNKQKLSGDLAVALQGADIFIGVSAPNIVSPEMIKTMNDRPMIFALSNPVPEIMPDLAKEAGAFIVASGRSDFPNQINNVLIFPGVFRGALDREVKQITDGMLIRAAENLAALVLEPTVDMILPNPLNRDVAPAVAKAIYE
ncbi:NADP-dependent malic enzyme [Candidatus Falkowbacteria bacterium]|uniref:NAD-dependent malic enzyme n=1 Tax=Candidatus Falkowbacteria bacterium CG10_big_fil_rev_8_21_14_0_10_37_18 TaxID=1974562 RepID=A0A2H0VBH1_9BACT|nr:NADP-dependent malic enzyme [Candidatus Falkowbacteria bacterium]NCQ12508.1 NADP-dependent malic enzyme [Candidatus Falkowbacteria bacterium]OIO06066.1 MAG: NAD-dependent malic enzyme [Candidatus Falkowbacteria bacterium CG1_02_37_21]PIR95699.1 MAG: NAD-dependent malic enzyme [Candidatus Falkowbacteria bacterium CG10_big_fil_rev_8_21_14_0_10_37_18]